MIEPGLARDVGIAARDVDAPCDRELRLAVVIARVGEVMTFAREALIAFQQDGCVGVKNRSN